MPCGVKPHGCSKRFCLPTADGVTKLEFKVPKPCGYITCHSRATTRESFTLVEWNLTVRKDALPNKSVTKLNLSLKCVRLALIQMAICRFHRRGNAILVKVLNISTSICNLPCKPAAKFRF